MNLQRLSRLVVSILGVSLIGHPIALSQQASPKQQPAPAQQPNPSRAAGTLITPFESSDGRVSSDYHSTIAFYEGLAEAHQGVSIQTFGLTDSGEPLHVVLVSDAPRSLAQIASLDRSVLLINNAIHPGEPDGIDASMAFARDLATQPENAKLLDALVVAIIPVYNIGGALNRNEHSRANQNGPARYGFRGNARNFDLNRDFIKCDTENARSFAALFQLLQPDLLIDTHVSNGADYQHVMTTAHSQKDKLGFELGQFLDGTFQPQLFERMNQRGFPTVPYVNSGGKPPEQGYSQFLDTPRYSTGYAALFQTIGFMTETHMLKPFPTRVRATLAFLEEAADLLVRHRKAIDLLQSRDRTAYQEQKQATLQWKLDRSVKTDLMFHGFAASYVDSSVTTGKRLFYDRAKPFVRSIPFHNHYIPATTVELPRGYLVPRGWRRVIDRLKTNGVAMIVAKEETSLSAEVYSITDFSSRTSPYEGHYFHDNVSVEANRCQVNVMAGDVIIPLDQWRSRYIVETLEPEASDSLFRWNEFDSILQRKEYFSGYVFEETAEKMLTEDASLRKDFETKRETDADFASDRDAQLRFLYERSKHNEPEYRRYPIARLLELK